MKVRRIKPGCCGMIQGQIYEAQWETENVYIRIKLDNGEWTSGHWFPDFFEIV